MKSHHDKIRQCLRDHPDGRTAAQIAECAGIVASSLSKSFDTCFGVYIDRWEGPFRGQWRAVYCLADVPENCPRPS